MPDLPTPFLEYGITIAKKNTPGESAAEAASIPTVLQAVRQLAAAMGGASVFTDRLAGVRVEFRKMKDNGIANAHSVQLNPHQLTPWTVVHEMAHAWDAAHHWQFAAVLQRRMGAGHLRWHFRILHLLYPDDPQFWYLPGCGPPPCGIDRYFNAREDFAESVTAFLFPDQAAERARTRGWPYHDPARGYSYPGFHATPRGGFIRNLLAAGMTSRD